MRTHKLWMRSLRNAWKRMRRCKCEVCLISGVCVVLLLWFKMPNGSSPPFSYCTPIDVVYTWVNGSDPAFIKAARRYDPSYDPARFDDKNELRYSLRSIELNAPWVRHVYIVTNGQIPHWLDLSYERVTVVPHDALASRPDLLPTFSSAAIETFLHRIPLLSKRFLYMNDDIFLGAPLYPEDLYTEADGVRVYQAWMVPDCAEDCPWTYIGDGACDRHCNIAECQYDGGDCSTMPLNSEQRDSSIEHEVEGDGYKTKTPKQPINNATKTNPSDLPLTHSEIRNFPKRHKLRKFKQIPRSNSSSTFKELMRHRNLTTLKELRLIVEGYNKRKKLKLPQAALFASSTIAPLTAARSRAPSDADTIGGVYKSSKDIYSHSLIHTNMLLNRHYGFKARSVLAHVGFLLDRDIIAEMQAKFADDVLTTVSNRFRSANDLQFAFAYYSFLVSETRSSSVSEIFDDFDTDASQTWSDREIRTFLARMYPLPLDWSAMRFFEEVVSNCSRDLGFDSRVNAMVFNTLVYERYEDSNVPTITRELVSNCPLLAEALEANFGVRHKYKYNINSKRAIHSNFMMLTSNVTDVVDALDKIRRNPRKFNCINDNLEPQYAEDNDLIRHLLEDFYLSFFPRRSKFELQAQYRNRFANWWDYQRWRRRKRAALVVGYGASIVLIMFLLRFLCMHKAKFVRRYVQKL